MVHIFIVIAMALVFAVTGCARFGNVPVQEMALQVATIEVLTKNPEYKPIVVEKMSAALELIDSGEVATLSTLYPLIRDSLIDSGISPMSAVLLEPFMLALLEDTDKYVPTDNTWYTKDAVEAKKIISLILRAAELTGS
jgi:hypothetical protein